MAHVLKSRGQEGYRDPVVQNYNSDVDPSLKAADLALAKKMFEVLERHYPGQQWEVEVSHRQGVAWVKIPLFMGRNCWVIHIHTLKSDPGMRIVIRAGGEILERYRIPRQGFSLDHFIAARDRVPLHLLGTRGYVPA